jgi:hypothetical protein
MQNIAPLGLLVVMGVTLVIKLSNRKLQRAQL